MLRPEKGEGERPAKFHNSIKKAPLIFTTALLVGFPLCLGQAALASTSSFVQPGSQQYPQRTKLNTLQQSLPKTNQGLLTRPFTSLPSANDITSLESILTTYQTRLANLRTKAEERPDLNLSASIAAVQEDINLLITSIQQTRSLLALYGTHFTTLTKAIEVYNQAVARETSASSALTTANTVLSNARSLADNATALLATATESLTVTNTNLETVTVKAAAAKTALIEAQARYKTATDNVTAAQSLVDSLTISKNTIAADLVDAKHVLSSATQVHTAAQQNYNALYSELQDAIAAQATAQNNYDTLLIPDPTWTVPTYQKENTRLVPYTELQEVRTLVPTTTMIATGGVKAEVFNRQGYNNAPPLPTANEVPIHTTTVSTIDFNWGSGNVLGSNRSEDVIVRFTANLLVPQDGYYQFYSPADDGTQLNIAGMNVTSDWYDKGGGGTISDPVWIRAGIFYPFTLHYYENGGGAAVGFYTYSPQQGFNLVPTTWMGSSAEQQTTYEEVITYEEVTKYREEIYYTTEPVLTEGTLNVKINEGGEATFTAPAGAVFISSNLRYEAIGRPECGIDINPRLQGNSITLSADNSVWGDPCGGWYKHITGTLTYLGQPTAPLINDPALLPALQNANQLVQSLTAQVAQSESSLNSAQTSMNNSQTAVDTVQASLDDAIADLATASQTLDNTETSLATATSLLDDATLASSTADSELVDSTKIQVTAKSSYDQAVTTQATANQDLLSAQTSVDTATTELSDASLLTSQALNQKTSAETTANSTNSEYASALVAASSTTVDFTALETELAKPLPEPEPEPVEEGSQEIPAELSAENLMEVNLEAVDPTELTEAQAEQLIEAALETFLTAEEGSAEYEQALDALYLAAEQDDIELPAELAAIPGLADAVAVLNFLGNAGADMSPKVREESEKVVVATVVAAGAAIQSAAAAAATASAPSGGSRRIGK